MPITPIELASMAPKSQETVQMKSAELQKPTTDRINANAQVEEKAHQDTTTAIRPQQSDTPEFRYDAKNNGSSSQQYESGGGSKGKRRREQESERNAETEEEKKIGHGIDIRI